MSIKLRHCAKETYSASQLNDVDRHISLFETKRKTADDLLLDIVNCGVSCEDEKSPCHSIWESQNCTNIGDFHLPEPWNGDIEKAQLMFLGINPRHNAGELFPRTGYDWWMDGTSLNRERIVDFFKNRFSSQYEYVRGIPNGPVQVRIEQNPEDVGRSYRNAGGFYWKYLHMIARLVLGEDSDEGKGVKPGLDYVLSEIVHCKTLNESGVSKKCFAHCQKKWFTKVLEYASNVKYIVGVGVSVSRRLSTFLKCEPDCFKWYSVKISGHDYKVMFVYHSNAHRSYFDSLRDIFKANGEERIGLSKLPNDYSPKSESNTTIGARQHQIVNNNGDRLLLALNTLAQSLGKRPDAHNRQLLLCQIGGVKLYMRFTKNKPHVVFNLAVADKELFRNQYGKCLNDWGCNKGFNVVLGKGHSAGNGVQFKPQETIDLDNIECEELRNWSDVIIAELNHVIV